jgi:hypothetical protein
MAHCTRGLPRTPSFEHDLVDGIALCTPRDVNPSTGGDAKPNQQGWVNAFAHHPGIRQRAPKVDVVQRLTLDPVNDRLAVIIDKMREGATTERGDVRLWERADEMTREIKGLRRGEGADDLAKSFPGQVGIGCRPAEVVRVPFGESNEC